MQTAMAMVAGYMRTGHSKKAQQSEVHTWVLHTVILWYSIQSYCEARDKNFAFSDYPISTFFQVVSMATAPHQPVIGTLLG